MQFFSGVLPYKPAGGSSTLVLIRAFRVSLVEPAACLLNWITDIPAVKGARKRLLPTGDGGSDTGGSVYDLVLAKGLLTKEKLDEILSPENMMRPRFVR